MTDNNIICVSTSDPLIRWRVARNFFAQMMERCGYGTPNSEWLEKLPKDWDEKSIRLGEVIFFEQRGSRQFKVAYQNKSSHADVGTGNMNVDLIFDCFLKKTGVNYDITLLYVISSWDDQCLKDAFQLYESWMLKLSSEKEMEQLIEQINSSFK